MPLADVIQSLIHKLEMGGGARYLRALALVLAVLGLAVLYNSCAYQNISTPEGMDSAQLARNLATHQGYTTLFIRPLSIYLLQRRNQAAGLASTNFDYAEVRSAHPDIENPPVYPFVLAGLMKILPFHYTIELKRRFWNSGGVFQIYQPDFLIAVFNQILLLAAVVLTFFIARKLFDPGVAWLSAGLTIGSALLWRFSTSGLPTLLLLVLFLGLTWCLIQIEELARAAEPRPKFVLALVVAAAALAAVGALTRYAFGWVLVPLVLFLVFFSGQRRVLHVLTALGVFVALLSPWLLRNYLLSGMPFGTATFAAAGNTHLFPRFQLERSLHPELAKIFGLRPYLLKMMVNARGIVEHLPTLGGSWSSVLFLAGLLLGFRGVAIRRMRWFLLMCLGTFFLVQALGETQLSVENPEVNSENLMVLLAPLVFIYATSFFYTLLEQMVLPIIQLRYVVIALFLVLSCLSMVFALLPPKTNPVVYPPYYPPELQQISGWMRRDELMMSDVPWAVAWYGDRQCVWLTLNAEDQFDAVNYWIKPVQALYLTPETMDGRFVSDWIRPHDYSWGSFVVQAVLENQVPPKFPLRHEPTGFLPDRLFLTDRERWKMIPQ